jgi:hypothetical protein
MRLTVLRYVRADIQPLAVLAGDRSEQLRRD